LPGQPKPLRPVNTRRQATEHDCRIDWSDRHE
jgi:hypothetical protein